jgi:hypothetical protein
MAGSMMARRRHPRGPVRPCAGDRVLALVLIVGGIMAIQRSVL